MLFNSWLFVGFFVAVYLIYLRVGHPAQNWLLLGASYFFYACWDWRFLSLILISTGIDFLCARRMEVAATARTRRRLLLLSVTANLGLLGAFKYYDFFVSNLHALLTTVGLPCPLPTLGIIVPVGISFYTFQTMSYTIDVYRGRMPACRSLRDFALYVAFFPQLVAGPIERGQRLLPQVQQPRVLTPGGLRRGVWWVLLGYFMKVYVADNLSPWVDLAFSAAPVSGPTAFIGTYAFAFQIYCDFAGYSLIARGTALLMGFDLMENFHMPYLAVNPSDFWRRWHISLSTWLRDYLYIPLGGNRHGPRRTYVNLALTMLLGGLWHGAQWKFVLWGAFHGLLLILFRLFERSPAPADGTSTARTPAPRSSLLAAFRRLGATLGFFHLVCFGWLIFRCESLRQVWEFPYRIVTDWNWEAADREQLAVFGLLVGPVILLDLVAEWRRDVDFVVRWPWPVRQAAYVTILAVLALLGSRGQEQFIYFQF